MCGQENFSKGMKCVLTAAWVFVGGTCLFVHLLFLFVQFHPDEKDLQTKHL